MSRQVYILTPAADIHSLTHELGTLTYPKIVSTTNKVLHLITTPPPLVNQTPKTIHQHGISIPQHRNASTLAIDLVVVDNARHH
jgi:hypothetical protein